MKTWFFSTCVKSSDKAPRISCWAFWAICHLQAVMYVLFLTMSSSCSYLPVATSSRISHHVAKLLNWFPEQSSKPIRSDITLDPWDLETFEGIAISSLSNGHIWYAVEREQTIMVLQGCICGTKSYFMLCFQNLAELTKPVFIFILFFKVDR